MPCKFLAMYGACVLVWLVAASDAQTTTPTSTQSSCTACRAGDCLICSLLASVATPRTEISVESPAALNPPFASGALPVGQDDVRFAANHSRTTGSVVDCVHETSSAENGRALTHRADHPMRCDESACRRDMSSLANSRSKLASQLADYLTQDQHETDHIFQVLSMALEMTAENAQINALIANLHRDEHGRYHAMPATARPPANRENKIAEQLRTAQALQNEMLQTMAHIQANLHALSATVQELQARAELPRPIPPTDAPHPTSRRPFPVHPLQRQWELDGPRYPVKQVWHAEPVGPVRRTQPIRPVVNPPSREISPAPPSAFDSDQVPRQPWQLEPLVVHSYDVGEIVAPPRAPPRGHSTARLVHLLQTEIDPKSWNDGGRVHVTGPATTLVVRQTKENHRRISRKLAKLQQDPSQIWHERYSSANN